MTEEVKTIKLGLEPNYPPYAFTDSDGTLAGFGVDFAAGMNKICPDINIEVVEELWSNCWNDDTGVGSAVLDGTVDGCVSYIHTHMRNTQAEFSDAMLDDNKAAGILTLLDEKGNPLVTGMDDLAGKTLIDVAGWAPAAEELKFVKNQCTNAPFSEDVKVVNAEVNEDYDNPNDVAMKMLRDGEGDAIFLMADHASSYNNPKCPEDAVYDCELWKGFGEEYAYVQTGQFGYVVNGTTFSLSKKGSGIRNLLRPCMTKFMASRQYYNICAKHDLTDLCYKNSFFDEDRKTIPKYNKPTTSILYDCTDGYCPCSAGMTEVASSQNSDDGGFPVWAIVVIVVGAVLLLALLVVVSSRRKTARVQQERKDREQRAADEMKRRTVAGQVTQGPPVDSVTVSSGNSR